MKQVYDKEPLAVIGLAVALILHFIPGYTEIVDLFSPREIQEVTLDCSEPEEKELQLYLGDPDGEGQRRNHITFPIQCRLSNNTAEPISILGYGPALIDDRRSSIFLFGDSKDGLLAPISEDMRGDIVIANRNTPFLLRPREVWEFGSLFALPYLDIVLNEAEGCHPPTDENIDRWSGYVCLADGPIAFGNFLYTRIGIGFLDWDEYGQVVLLGDGRKVYHSAEKFMFIANCSDEDPRTTNVPVCKTTPRYGEPSTWTVD